MQDPAVIMTLKSSKVSDTVISAVVVEIVLWRLCMVTVYLKIFYSFVFLHQCEALTILFIMLHKLNQNLC